MTRDRYRGSAKQTAVSQYFLRTDGRHFGSDKLPQEPFHQLFLTVFDQCDSNQNNFHHLGVCAAGAENQLEFKYIDALFKIHINRNSFISQPVEVFLKLELYDGLFLLNPVNF